jgi:hypothetical protein
VCHDRSCLSSNFSIYPLTSEAEIPCVVNLGFRSQLSRTSQISAPSGSPIELCVSRDVSHEAARVIYCRTIFECTGAQEFSFFLTSSSERFRVKVKYVRFTQPTLPYEQIEFYMRELQNMYTIERALSAKRLSQLSDTPAELRPINHTSSNTRFLEVCRQKKRFTSIFVVKESIRAFKLVSARSETVDGIINKKDFNIRIKRLHYKEKILDIK